MEESFEQVDQMGQEEAPPSPEDRYYQRMRNTNATEQLSRQEMWQLFQELQAHHYVVQSRYEALESAIRSGQEHESLWREYQKAIEKHRLLVNRYRLAVQQRLAPPL